MRIYGSDCEALGDALRLSRTMTYKTAIIGANLGGGKAVILGDPYRQKTRQLLLAMASAVEKLGGRYIIADDVGTTVRDMDVLRTVTRYASGLGDRFGEPCPATACGVFHAIRALARHRLGREDLEDVTVAVQGAGAVGQRLARRLADAGARILISDIRPAAAERVAVEVGARVVAPEELLFAEVDVLAPCAMGLVLDDTTIPRLRCHGVAGAANNQLAAPRHAEQLLSRGIAWVPDYVASAGGVIDVAHEGPAYDQAVVLRDCARIYELSLDILERASREHITPLAVANRIAEARLERHRAAASSAKESAA